MMKKFLCFLISIISLCGCAPEDVEKTKSTLTAIGETTEAVTDKTKETLTTVGDTTSDVLHKSAVGLTAIGDTVNKIGAPRESSEVSTVSQDSRVHTPPKR